MVKVMTQHNGRAMHFNGVVSRLTCFILFCRKYHSVFNGNIFFMVSLP